MADPLHPAGRDSEVSQEGVETVLKRMQITGADHLPIVAAFCRRIGVIEAVNRVVPTQMEVDVGTMVQCMVLDTLSGRSPLYRLAGFMEHQDSEVLLGRRVPSSAFNDTTVARAMDAIFTAGAEKMFNEVAFQAALRFPLDMSAVHFDTTSISVWGDYTACGPDTGTIDITRGHSKDHRPDLKQFLVGMLCVGRNIPILGGCENGNASDKVLNNSVLSRISAHMAKYHIHSGQFLYVADCAMVTGKNLAAMGDNAFVTRLPFSYNEACRVVGEAVREGVWECVGSLNDTPRTASRPPAQYSIAEKTVTLYGQEYRALVVHSTAHDKRRLKRIERELHQSQTAADKLAAGETKPEYFCRADADASAERLSLVGTEFHRIETAVVEKPHYGRGRPPKNEERKPTAITYAVTAKVVEKAEQTARKREEAGCFVLLTNTAPEGPAPRSAAELLHAYKEQYGIERNFSFLKDPVIVNALFLKKPERIEALGAILLIALLVWNLIEHTLREYLAANHCQLPGWDNKPTSRPTTFMMSTKFTGLQLVRVGRVCRLARPLKADQLRYLKALGLSEHHLTSARLE